MPKKPLPRALTIAGSDSGGGGGIQADLKTFAALSVFGTSAITAVTAQNSRGVSAVHVLPPEQVRAQIDAVVTDIGADAVKIGMLANAPIINAVADALADHGLRHVVLDPVMVAASGDRLLDEEAVGTLAGRLLPLAGIVTPNRDEAAILADMAIDSADDMEKAAKRILELGARAVLVKGGHLGGDEVMDLYACGEDRITIMNRRLDVDGHGTGCTLSSALAAFLARGMDMTSALHEASAYLHEALRRGFRVGAGEPVVLEHFWPQKYSP